MIQWYPLFYMIQKLKVFFIFRAGGFMWNRRNWWFPQEKAQCVEWFIETRFELQVQRNFRTRYGRNPPSRTSIREWYKRFKETGSCQKQKSTGRPSTSAADVERVRESFQQNPRKSIRHASRELGLPTTTVHRILHKRLKFYANKVQELKPTERPSPWVNKTNQLPGIQSPDKNYPWLIYFTVFRCLRYQRGKLAWSWITAAWALVDAHILSHIWQELILLWCSACDKAHIEVCWWCAEN